VKEVYENAKHVALSIDFQLGKLHQEKKLFSVPCFLVINKCFAYLPFIVCALKLFTKKTENFFFLSFSLRQTPDWSYLEREGKKSKLQLRVRRFRNFLKHTTVVVIVLLMPSSQISLLFSFPLFPNHNVICAGYNRINYQSVRYLNHGIEKKIQREKNT
jgi:hypothetical protein